MKLKLLILFILSLLVLFAKGQGKTNSPSTPPSEYFVVKSLTGTDERFSVEIIKSWEAKDTLFSFFVSQKKDFSIGDTLWCPVLCFTLGKEVFEPVLAYFDGVLQLYYQDERKNFLKIDLVY